MVFPTNGLAIKVLIKLVAIGAPLLRAPMATRAAEGMVASLLQLVGSTGQCRMSSATLKTQPD